MKQPLPQSFYFEHSERAVLLLHAYSGSPNDVRMLGRKLEKADYSVYAPLFKGHGTLEPLDILTAGPDAWLQDVEAALTFLRSKGMKKIAVLGLSLGGVYALKALTNYPDLIGGGSFCSPVVPNTKGNILPNFLAYSEKVLRYKGLSAAESKKQLALIKEKAPQQLRAIQAFRDQLSTELDKIKQPVFLAQAGKDEMVDPEQVFVLAKCLKQAKLTIEWYPNSGHVLTIDPAHHQLEADVLHFLAQLPWTE